MSSSEQVAQVVLYLLNGGLGAAIKFVMDWLINELKESGRNPSPRTRRWLTYAVCTALPSVLYLLYTLALRAAPYDVWGHLLAISSAFAFSQVVHGATELKAGVPGK